MKASRAAGSEKYFNDSTLQITREVMRCHLTSPRMGDKSGSGESEESGESGGGGKSSVRRRDTSIGGE